MSAVTFFLTLGADARPGIFNSMEAEYGSTSWLELVKPRNIVRVHCAIFAHIWSQKVEPLPRDNLVVNCPQVHRHQCHGVLHCVHLPDGRSDREYHPDGRVHPIYLNGGHDDPVAAVGRQVATPADDDGGFVFSDCVSLHRERPDGGLWPCRPRRREWGEDRQLGRGRRCSIASHHCMLVPVCRVLCTDVGVSGYQHCYSFVFRG